MRKLYKIILGEATARISVLVLALSEVWELLLGLVGEALLEEIFLKVGRREEDASHLTSTLIVDQYLPKLIPQRHFHSHKKQAATCDQIVQHIMCFKMVYTFVPISFGCWKGSGFRTCSSDCDSFPPFHSKPWRNFLHHFLLCYSLAKGKNSSTSPLEFSF